jgi:hypothetical protein
MKKEDIISKIHLIISVVILVPAAVVYGFEPSLQFNIEPKTIDEHNVFKAIMGLYLGFSIIWLLGVFRLRYFKMALLSNLVFMLGLGFGRLLSFFVDGTPTIAYQLGMFGELVLGLYGLWVYNSRYNESSNAN